MNVQEFYDRIVEEVAQPMIDFMQECGDDAAFSAFDVESCKMILRDYLDALSALAEPTDEAIMAQVRKTVLALNELNEETEYALIETSEREAICILIQDAAVECGLQAENEDVTEEWREW
ncbi:MAG: hypothetical protein E7318_13155 [Clostridiales bacterium]|nr:hypothetical protein [Clostridiales bacterium]